MIKQIKSVDTYLKKNKLYIQPQSLTKAGFWVWDTDGNIIENPNIESNIGDHLEQAFKRSRSGIIYPFPKGYEFQSILEITKMSWNLFMKDALCVGIKMEDNKVTFIPTRNGGVKNGFAETPEKIFTNIWDKQKAGELLLEAFLLCE